MRRILASKSNPRFELFPSDTDFSFCLTKIFLTHPVSSHLPVNPDDSQKNKDGCIVLTINNLTQKEDYPLLEIAKERRDFIMACVEGYNVSSFHIHTVE